jgi:hypothetical protein
MFSRMMQLINKNDSLYLAAADRDALLEYTNSLPKRFRAARRLEREEDAIARQCMEKIRQRHGSFELNHDAAWDKGHRDVQLVLRACVQAMLMDDVTIAEDKLYGWLRVLFAGLGFEPALVRDTFTTLTDICRERLSAEEFGLLRPHLEHAVTALADLPEPVFATV